MLEPTKVKNIIPEGCDCGRLDLVSIVKTSQILTVDKNRLEKRLGWFSREKMKEVNQAIKLSLDL
jgi:mRNA interferase MazF